MTNKIDLNNHLVKVVESCRTSDQLLNAIKYAGTILAHRRDLSFSEKTSIAKNIEEGVVRSCIKIVLITLVFPDVISMQTAMQQEKNRNGNLRLH